MKSGRGSRGSRFPTILTSFFVLSIFLTPSASALDWSSISIAINTDQDITLEANAVYEVGSTITSEVGNNEVYFDTYLGNLNGNGATFTGLVAPLFERVGSISDDGASVLNLNLVSEAGVIGRGALAIEVSSGTTIDNVTFVGDVNGGGASTVGGLVGGNSGLISNSSVSGTVIGTDTVGGLVGSTYGSVSDSTFTGTVQGQRYVGGLVGVTGSSTISSSSASGIVTGLASDEGNIGGLVGGGSGTISDSTTSVAVTGYAGTSNIGGLIGNADVNVQIIDSSSSGTVTGTSNVGGLAGQISGSLITNSSSSAVVNGGSNVGGLVGNAITYGPYYSSEPYYEIHRGISSPENGDPGYLGAEIEDSFSTGAVNGGTYTGGLVGYLEGDVTNSYSISSVNQLLTGDNAGNRLGGLVGVMASGSVSDTYATGGGYSVGGFDFIGGLVGQATGGNIVNSYSSISGNVSSDSGYVGGLVGYTNGNISNSYARLTGNVTGNSYAGGLAGFADTGSTITYSYSSGNVIGTGTSPEYIGSLVGYLLGDIYWSYSTGSASGSGGLTGGSDNQWAWVDNSCEGSLTDGNFICTDETIILDETFLLNEIGNLGASFALDECLNGPNPYLISLSLSYENSCSGGDGGEDGTPTPPRRDRFEREFREVLETRTPEKIEKLDGFKKEAQLVKDAAIAFVEPTEKIELTKVKAVEITATANVRVNAKADEALQISLKSESKEPVELWVKSPDGKWLLAGVITFDKDGKAILPPLKFKNVGNYSLVLSKPTVDSAKGSAPLDQMGSLLVAVS